MNDIELVTVEHTIHEFKCILTQIYHKEYKFGNWKGAIFDREGNLHHCIFSCSSKQGKITEGDAFKELEYWLEN